MRREVPNRDGTTDRADRGPSRYSRGPAETIASAAQWGYLIRPLVHRGGRQLPAGRQIDWGNFADALARPENGLHHNHPRDVDTLISSSLFQLSIPGSEATGSNVLAFRNLVRAKFYDIPSGQTVAEAMGILAIAPTDAALRSPAIPASFADGTPLWYYVLYESEQAGGKKLGPVGGRIVADVMTRLLLDDPNGIIRTEFVPAAPIASTPGQFGLADFFVFAGLATRP